MKQYRQYIILSTHDTRISESGSTIVVGLVILLVLTILGIVAMQTTTLEERMAGNLRDRNIAFQAAEAALREGESFLTVATLPPFDNADGLYKTSTWRDPVPSNAWADSNSSWAYEGEIEGVYSQPRYIIEELPSVPEPLGSLAADEPIPDVGLYRVTSRGVGGTDTAVVILQTIYKR